VILSRTSDEEFPLADLNFDGKVLRLRMQASKGQTQAVMTALVMTLTGHKFEGYWRQNETENVGPNLKLVRARK
jgi:hypothetical protein